MLDVVREANNRDTKDFAEFPVSKHILCAVDGERPHETGVHAEEDEGGEELPC